MRVTVISAAFPPLRAGESDYVLWLCERLAERYGDVDLVTTKGAGAAAPSGIRASTFMRDWTWQEMPRLLLHVRSRRPDIVVMPYLGWLSRRHPMVNFLPAALKAVCPGTRFHTVLFDSIGLGHVSGTMGARAMHGLYEIGAALRHGVRRAAPEHGPLLAQSDSVVVFSEAHREALVRQFPQTAARVHVIPAFPLVDAAPDAGRARREGRSRAHVEESQFLFVHFGYVAPGKGIDTLLQAFARISSQRPEARLALVGGTADERYSGWATYGECLRHLAWALRIEDKVRWMGGYEPKSDLPSKCLFAGDAAVLPFDSGIGLNQTSAAAAVWHGLPLLSTAGQRLAPEFVTEENSLLSAPRDVEALARSMQRVMDDRELAGKLHHGALDLAQRCFSPDRALESLDRLFKDRNGGGVPR